MVWFRKNEKSAGWLKYTYKYPDTEETKDLLYKRTRFMLLILATAAVVCWLNWPSKVDIEALKSTGNKIYYRHVIEYVDYEDIVYYPSDKIDENRVSKAAKEDNSKRLLTEGVLRENFHDGETKALYRRRRDFHSQTERYGEYRRLRSANSDVPTKTVTVVRNNRIKNAAIDHDNVEVKTNSDTTSRPEHEPELPDSDSEKNLSEMDITYLKTLEACEAQILAAKGNDTGEHDNTTSEGGGDGHHDRCASEIASGVPALWVILYVAIILFLFIGLAIICDDFFISSLEAISEKLNLSEDVAGATFMAAGSSAPELFISVAGAGTGSDVGVGTIVGSAVFNLLIIIALTAALAGKVLCLDWRPFVRDSIFYAMSIVAFIAFSLDTQFQFWESLTLLLLYILYIVVMKFNPQLMACMAKWKCCSCFESRISPEEENGNKEDAETSPKTVNTQDPPKPESSETNFPVAAKPNPKPILKSSVSPETTLPKQPPYPEIAPPSTPVELTPKKQQTLAPPSPDISRNAKEDSVGTRSGNDSGICMCGVTNPSPEPNTCTCCVIHVSAQPCGLGCVSYGVIPRIRTPISRCASCGSIREQVNVVIGQGQKPDNMASNVGTEYGTIEEKNGYLPNLAIKDSGIVTSDVMTDTTSSSNENSNSSKTATCSFCGCGGDDIAVVRETFKEENNSIDVGAPPEDTKQNDTEATEDEVPTIVILPCLPKIKNPPPNKPNSSECIPGTKYIIMYIVYILSFPWVIAFTWTVPKCNTPKNRKWYLASFFLCIVWIALVSWIMIELVEKVGCLLGIDTYTMGLVIVAVGTSVPDAISSVLVAKEGYGDMAVSNALGSNVFDINLGLGLPFFITSLITSSPVALLSPIQMCLFESLPLPIKIVPHVKFGFILLLVLLIAVGTFMFVRFRLNRKVTILFITMYVAFMIYAFVQEKKCYSFFC